MRFFWRKKKHWSLQMRKWSEYFTPPVEYLLDGRFSQVKQFECQNVRFVDRLLVNPGECLRGGWNRLEKRYFQGADSWRFVLQTLQTERLSSETNFFVLSSRCFEILFSLFWKIQTVESVRRSEGEALRNGPDATIDFRLYREQCFDARSLIGDHS